MRQMREVHLNHMLPPFLYFQGLHIKVEGLQGLLLCLSDIFPPSELSFLSPSSLPVLL